MLAKARARANGESERTITVSKEQKLVKRGESREKEGKKIANAAKLHDRQSGAGGGARTLSL